LSTQIQIVLVRSNNWSKFCWVALKLSTELIAYLQHFLKEWRGKLIYFVSV